MPLPKIAKLFPLDPKNPSRELTFREGDVKRKQARFKDRWTLVPEIDVKSYRFTAVIDFVTVRVFTRSTQHQWIQQDLRTVLPRDCWITPIDIGAGGVADAFDIKIQEPKSSALVVDAIEAVSKKRGMRKPPQICEIEFSLDVYSRTGCDEAREKMVGLLQRTYFAETARWRNDLDQPRTTAAVQGSASLTVETKRIVPWIGEMRSPRLTIRPALSEFSTPFLDGTLYLGQKNKSGMIRIQNKVRDQQNPAAGTFTKLTSATARARVEVTLNGQDLGSLGLEAVSDLKEFNYTKLQKRFFQFKLPTFAAENPNKSAGLRAMRRKAEHDRAEVFLRSGLLALLRRDEVWERYKKSQRGKIMQKSQSCGRSVKQDRTGRGSSMNMVAYDALNKEVALAFRHFSDRERRAWQKKTLGI